MVHQRTSAAHRRCNARSRAPARPGADHCTKALHACRPPGHMWARTGRDEGPALRKSVDPQIRRSGAVHANCTAPLIAGAKVQCQVDRSATTDSRIYGLADLRTCVGKDVQRREPWPSSLPRPGGSGSNPQHRRCALADIRNYGTADLRGLPEAWRFPCSRRCTPMAAAMHDGLHLSVYTDSRIYGLAG